MWIPRFLRKAFSIWLKVSYPFDGFGRGVSIHYTCEIQRFYAHKIRIEDSVILDSDVWLNVPVISSDSQPTIVVGKGSSVGRRSVISARNRVWLEEDVLVAPAVFITDHNHEYSDVNAPIATQGITPGGKILIERNCWLGYGSMILGTKGDLVLGRNSVVGAYSVVTQSCPPYSVLVGNPAKVVKYFDAPSQMWLDCGENGPHQRSDCQDDAQKIRGMKVGRVKSST
jgi:acetyltransferase-like isoleucine patch superfamily enzyme